MRNFFKYLKRVLGIFLIPPFIYSIFLIVGGSIPVNSDGIPNGEILVYIIQNGSHTDIVVPVENEIINWRKIILPEHFQSLEKNPQYFSFGWGDLEFYRNTPYWSDLDLNTGFNALFLNTPSAIHVTELDHINSKKLIQLNLTAGQYWKLTEYILKHLEFTSEYTLQPLKFHYSYNDVFYKSKSTFHAFRTCNTWVNNAIKYAGLRSCLWTSLSWPIFWQHS